MTVELRSTPPFLSSFNVQFVSNSFVWNIWGILTWLSWDNLQNIFFETKNIIRFYLLLNEGGRVENTNYFSIFFYRALQLKKKEKKERIKIFFGDEKKVEISFWKNISVSILCKKLCVWRFFMRIQLELEFTWIMNRFICDSDREKFFKMKDRNKVNA